MKRTIKTALLLIAGAAGLQAVPAAAQTTTSSQAGMTREKDGKFVADLMANNTYELFLLKLISAKAQNEELRAVAAKMMPEHQKMDAQITAYSNRIGFAMAPDHREKVTEKIRKWDGKTSGAGWDSDMIEELTDVHKDGIDMLTDAQSDIKDEEFKRMITASLPILKDHLYMLAPLKDKVKDGLGRATPESSAATASRQAAAADLAADPRMQGDPKDAKFVSDMMEANVYEISLMELALKKAHSRDLKDAAMKMLSDHQALNRKVRTYASSKAYGIDPEDGADMKEKVNKWATTPGGMEWDADIIEELIDAHKDGIDMLTDARSGVKDNGLMSLMDETLASLRSHLQMLEPLKEKVKKPWKEK